MKKIAVLFFGQPRFAMDQLIVKKRNLFMAPQSDKIDIFAHMWYDQKNLLAQTIKWQVNSEDVQIERGVPELFSNYYKPIQMVVQSPRKFEVSLILKNLLLKRFRHNPQNINTFISGMVSQLYSMQAVSKLCSAYCLEHNFQYDLIMFLRYDTIFLEKLNFSEFDQNFLYLDNLPRPFPDIWIICGFKYLQWANDLYDGLQDIKPFYSIIEASSEQLKRSIFLKHFDQQRIKKVDIQFYVKRTPELLTSSKNLERRIFN